MITSGYRERPSTVPGAVLWTSGEPGTGEVLPDGCMDLIWTAGRIVVAGPDLVPFRPGPSTERSVGLRLPPGLLPHLLRVPAAELVNRRFPLADLSPARPMIRSVRPDRPGLELEGLVKRLLAEVSTDELARATAAGRMLARGTSVSAVADRLGVEPRSLHRLGLEWFGYGPKTLARILRLRRALRHAESNTSGATVAALSGYADQSHLNRDARKITGRPFGELTARRKAEYP